MKHECLDFVILLRCGCFGIGRVGGEFVFDELAVLNKRGLGFVGYSVVMRLLV